MPESVPNTEPELTQIARTVKLRQETLFVLLKQESFRITLCTQINYNQIPVKLKY